MTESKLSARLLDQAENLYDTLLPLLQADAPDVYGRKVKAQAAIVEALALRTPSDGEVVAEPAAWEGYWPGAGSISSQTSLTRFRSTMEKWEKDGAEITPLYTRPHPGKE